MSSPSDFSFFQEFAQTISRLFALCHKCTNIFSILLPSTASNILILSKIGSLPLQAIFILNLGNTLPMPMWNNSTQASWLRSASNPNKDSCISHHPKLALFRTGSRSSQHFRRSHSLLGLFREVQSRQLTMCRIPRLFASAL